MTLFRTSRGRLLAVLLAASLLGAGFVTPVCADDDSLEPRAFEIRFRSLDDAYEVISAVLSPDADVTFRPRLKTLVVQDRKAVLDRVATLLESYDVPPRNAEITISLVLGTDNREAEVGGGEVSLSTEVRGVLERVTNFTRWTGYEALGTRSVTGAEGSEVIADLSDEYRVVFVLEAVLVKQGMIKFERFALQRFVKAEDGTGSYKDLYVAGMTLQTDRVSLVGAAQGAASKTALFLAVQATLR